jgi:hypothetical protein
MINKQLNGKQLDWVRRMRSNLALLHNQWYGWDGNLKVNGGMDRELFAETDRKIRDAASRLNIEVECAGQLAEENEGWDGEMNGDLVVLGHVLDAIKTGETAEQKALRLRIQNPQWFTARFVRRY